MTPAENLQKVAVEVFASSGVRASGSVQVRHWTRNERRNRALKKTGRIVGTVIAIAPVALFVHVLALIMATAVVTVLVAAGPLFFRFYSEEATFERVDGNCPCCSGSGTLRPYTSPKFSPPVTVLCGACGQTMRADIVSA